MLLRQIVITHGHMHIPDNEPVLQYWNENEGQWKDIPTIYCKPHEQYKIDSEYDTGS